MPVLVSGCYYHPDRATVAFCAKCGVGICQECAVNDIRGRVVCRQCANEELRQEHREYRKQLKANGGRFVTGKDFLVPGIIGILLVIAAQVGFALQILYSNPFYSYDSNLALMLMIMTGIALTYYVFSMPFCWLILSDLIPIYYTSEMNPINAFKRFFKLCFTISFGWLVFTVIWVRFLIRKHRSKKANLSAHFRDKQDL